MPSAKPSLTDSLTEVWRIMFIGYSTGSSSVMMLTLSVLIWLMIEYSVVVLPLPVGPVTRITPSGRAIMSFNKFNSVSARPRASSGTMPFWRSSTRSTKFSPCVVGCADARKSICRPENLMLMRPSCGARASAIFMFDITFRRTAMAGQYDLCRLRICRRMPSMR